MDTHNRRLPIYILIDCSESMVGEPLDAVGQGLKLLCLDLKTHPQLIEVAWLSVITFSNGARQVCPLTEVLSFTEPRLSVGPGTSLGAALDLLGDCIVREVRSNSPTQKGDWKPVVFLLTDGQPTDAWKEALARYRASTARRVADLVAVACGPDADASALYDLTPTVLLGREINVGQMQKLFRMVSTSVAAASEGGGSTGIAPGGRIPEGFALAAKSPGATAGGKPPTQIILAARCQKGGQGYLMRYRLDETTAGGYQAEKSYPVGPEYLAAAAGGPSGQSVDSSKLKGCPPCPYCKRPGWTVDKGGIVCADTMHLARRRAQVMFVLDCTGSMEAEIEGVKDSISGFMDYIQSEGLSVEAGLIAFRDLQENEPPEVLQFEGRPFTRDAKLFKKRMAPLTAEGGGMNPGESSFDALVRACRQPFDKDAARILIVITDEPPLLPDGEVKDFDDIAAALAQGQIDQLHFVIPAYVEPIYRLLHRMVKGSVFPLVEGQRGAVAFQKVLMDVGKSITVATRLG
jgi:uncharacterized protein YegL